MTLVLLDITVLKENKFWNFSIFGLKSGNSQRSLLGLQKGKNKIGLDVLFLRINFIWN